MPKLMRALIEAAADSTIEPTCINAETKTYVCSVAGVLQFCISGVLPVTVRQRYVPSPRQANDACHQIPDAHQRVTRSNQRGEDSQVKSRLGRSGQNTAYNSARESSCPIGFAGDSLGAGNQELGCPQRSQPTRFREKTDR